MYCNFKIEMLSSRIKSMLSSRWPNWKQKAAYSFSSYLIRTSYSEYYSTVYEYDVLHTVGLRLHQQNDLWSSQTIASKSHTVRRIYFFREYSSSWYSVRHDQIRTDDHVCRAWYLRRNSIATRRPSDRRDDVAQQANERPRHWLEAFPKRDQDIPKILNSSSSYNF